MRSTSRFDCASSALKLGQLLRRTQGVLWVCFALGVAIHLSLTGMRGIETQQSAAKPLTTQFVKRAPRLTKPLELKKRPRPKQRQMQRSMVSVRARADQRELATRVLSSQMVGRLARPSAPVVRSTSLADLRPERPALAAAIVGTKEAGARVDATLEMMDVGALDTGKYHAMVIQDPSDKRSVRGFFHLAQATSRNMFLGYWEYLKPRFVMAMLRLANAMNRYTSIETDLAARVGLDSNEIFKVPWVYVMTAFSLRFTETESSNFGAYLASGGTAFLDDLLHAPGGPGDLALRELLTAALKTQGMTARQEWTFEKLPNSHAVYHCYFDFDGPPLGVYLPIYFAGTAPGNTERLADYLEGVYLGERLAAIMSNQAYANAWGDWGPDGTTSDVRSMYGRLDPTRPLQFGVNLVIFALTQEGAVTQQVMQGVNY